MRLETERRREGCWGRDRDLGMAGHRALNRHISTGISYCCQRFISEKEWARPTDREEPLAGGRVGGHAQTQKNRRWHSKKGKGGEYDGTDASKGENELILLFTLGCCQTGRHLYIFLLMLLTG